MPIADEKWVRIRFQEIKSSCISHNGKRENEANEKIYKIHPYTSELYKREKMHKKSIKNKL